MTNLFARAASLLLGEQCRRHGRLRMSGRCCRHLAMRPLTDQATPKPPRRDAPPGPLLQSGIAVCARFRACRPRRARSGQLWRRIRSRPSPTPCMPAGSPSSAFPASVFRRRKRFRDVSARASNIFPNCRPRTTCCNRPRIGRAGVRSWVRRRRDVRGRVLGAPAAPRCRTFVASRHAADRRWRGLAAGRSVPAPPAAQQEVKPPFPLSTGSAAGTSWDAAAAARPARTDRAGRGQPLVAGWQPRQIRFRRSMRPRSAARPLLAQLRQGMSGAAELVARHHDGYRRAQRRGGLLQRRMALALPLASPRGRRSRPRLSARPFWKCARANWPMRWSRRSAGSAGKPRSTRGTGFTGGAPPMINADRCLLLQPVPEPAGASGDRRDRRRCRCCG